MKISRKVLAVTFALAFQHAGASRKLPQGEPGGSPHEPGEVVTPDLGDLIRLLRDESTGVPILTDALPIGSNCNGDGVTGCCLRPLASEECYDTDCVVMESDYHAINTAFIDPVTCAVMPPCDTCTMETEFGRISSARAPADVFDKSYIEAITMLKQSVCPLFQEPSGRLGYFATLEEVIKEYTIDSPLSNLALYREVMNTGELDLPPELFPDSAPLSLLELAAVFFGAAFDKTGSINMDTVVYTNAIFGLPTTSELPKVCILIRGEEMGEVAAREKCFIDYSDMTLGYSYNRQENFARLPNPAYIPNTPEPQNGQFEFLKLLDDPSATELKFHIANADILEHVFQGYSPVNDMAALSFAQAADDTRAVINFMHNWPVPGDYATKHVACTPNEIILYNLYIVSLQVPKFINVGAVDRELLVTVGNSGRDSARKVTLSVTGKVDGTGLIRELGYSGTPYTLEVGANEPFDLKSGETRTFTGFVPAQLTTGGQGSTIEWTATVNKGPDGLDILPEDNIMTAESGVKGGGGGGGRGGRGGGRVLRGL